MGANQNIALATGRVQRRAHAARELHPIRPSRRVGTAHAVNAVETP